MLCSSGAKGTWRCKLTAGIRRQPCSVAVAGDPTAMLCNSGVGRSRDRKLTTFLGIFFCCYALPKQNRTGSCIACSVAVLFSSEGIMLCSSALQLCRMLCSSALRLVVSGSAKDAYNFYFSSAVVVSPTSHMQIIVGFMWRTTLAIVAARRFMLWMSLLFILLDFQSIFVNTTLADILACPLLRLCVYPIGYDCWHLSWARQ